MSGWEFADGSKSNDGWEFADESPSFIDKVKGVGEAALSMTTGGLAMIGSGLAGIPAAAIGGNDAGSHVVKSVQEAGTYEPRTAKGKEYNENVNSLISRFMEKQVYPTMYNVVDAVPFISDQITPDQKEAWARGISDVGMNFLPIEAALAPVRMVKGKKGADAHAADAAAKKLEPVDTPAKAEAAGWEFANEVPHQQEMFPQNPYDVGGHVTAAQEGRPTMLDNPQGEMFGRNEALIPDNPREPGLPPIERVGDEVPRLPETPKGEQPLPFIPTDEVPRIPGTGPEFPNIEAQHSLPFPKLEEPAPRTPLDVGLTDAAWDNGVRHTDPQTGGIVQGGDASIPTVDFPLKTELIDRDPNIQSLRERIAATEADVAQMREAGKDTSALEGTLEYLKQEFGDYMDKSYGVLEKGDAYPAIFEAGADTKLPIKQTHNAGRSTAAGKKGFNFKSKKQQGGSVNLDLITFGLAKHAENFRKWFGGSVVKDAEGHPIKVYHGTSKDVDFDSFRAGKRGIWFTENAKEASQYAVENDSMTYERVPGSWNMKPVNTASRVIPAYLKIENPYKLTPEDVQYHRTASSYEKAQREIFDKARALGHDGVEMGNGIWVAFSPEQVKSATGNNGNFAPNKKKMTGAIDPDLLTLGLSKIFKGTKQAEPLKQASTVDVVQALKDSTLGKGLGDMMSWADIPPEQVVQAAREWKNADGSVDIKPARVQELIETGALPRELATKHPVVKYVGGLFHKAAQIANKDIRLNLMDKENGLLGKLRKINADEKAELWAQAALYEGGKTELTSDMLRERGFNDKQIAAHEKLRALMDDHFERFNEKRVQAGLEPIDKRTMHLFGRFMGDFQAMAYRVKLDKDGNPKVLPDGTFEKEVIGRIPGFTKWEAKKAVEHIKQQHPDWEVGSIQFRKSGQGTSAAARYAGFMEVVNIMSKDNPYMGELVKAYEDYLASDATKFLNAMRHAKEKKSDAMGVQGSEGNQAWLSMKENADRGFKAQIAALEQSYTWMAMQDATAKAKQVLGDEYVAANMPNAVGWSNQFIDHALGRSTAPMARFFDDVVDFVGEHSGIGTTKILKGSNNLKHLMMQMWMGFGNVKFTVTQLAQPLQTMPAMTAWMKARGTDFSIGKAGVEATMSMLKFGYDNIHRGVFPDAPLTQFEKMARDYAHDNGVFDVRMMDHTKDINVSPAKELFDAAADANIKYAEMYTRGTAFMFYAHALGDAGLPMSQVFPIAENMTRQSMIDYTQQARPRMYGQMGWVGDIASTLSRFRHGNTYSNTMFYGREAFKQGHYSPLAAHILGMVVVGGIKGTIGYAVADKIVKLWTTHVSKKPNSLTNMIMGSKAIPEIVSHGIPAAAGVDMTGSFANDLLPDSPMDAAMPYAADTGRRIGATLDMVKQPNEFNVKKFLHAQAPNSVKGALENQFFTTQDKADPNKFHTINPRTMEAGEDRDTKSMMLRNFGFRTMKDSNASQRLYEQKYSLDQPRMELKAAIMEKVKADLLSNNLTPEKLQAYGRQYNEVGETDTFARDFQQKVKAMHLTPTQRYIMRNAGGNVTGAKRLQHFKETER